MQRLRQPEPPVRFRGRGGVVSERTCCMEGRGGCLWLAQWQVKKKTTRFSVSFFIEKCGHEQGLPHSGAVRLRGTSVLADGPESWRRGNSFALNIEISSGNQKNNHTFWCGYFRGGLEGIRTLDLSDANKPRKLFSIISGHFWLFPLRSTSSLGLFDHAVSMWSGTVCGRLCGQKRSPALADVFRRQGRGAFFMPLTACIVPLSTGLSKSFLCRPQLRNWGTGNKKRHFAFEDEETLQSVQAAAQTT